MQTKSTLILWVGLLCVVLRSCRADPDGGFTTTSEGTVGTLEYRISTLDADGNTISPWHDIALYTKDGNVNFYCEIPLNTTAKYETQTEEPGNRIAQDEKNGKPRDYPYPILWNYGMLPQTWEDPDNISEELGGVGGDNDPTDVVEIGGSACTSGQVYEVKPICAFAMIDDGEVDWKVIVISSDLPEASRISTAADVDNEFPGELQRIYEWFRDYKIPAGDPPAEFGYNATCVDGDIFAAALEQSQKNYQNLISGARENTEEKALPEIKSESQGPAADFDVSGAGTRNILAIALSVILASVLY